LSFHNRKEVSHGRKRTRHSVADTSRPFGDSAAVSGPAGVTNPTGVPGSRRIADPEPIIAGGDPPMKETGR
jgi:hypothetical protein